MPSINPLEGKRIRCFYSMDKVAGMYNNSKYVLHFEVIMATVSSCWLFSYSSTTWWVLFLTCMACKSLNLYCIFYKHKLHIFLQSLWGDSSVLYLSELPEKCYCSFRPLPWGCTEALTVARHLASSDWGSAPAAFLNFAWPALFPDNS